jgi:hypothetical protein
MVCLSKVFRQGYLADIRRGQAVHQIFPPEGEAAEVTQLDWKQARVQNLRILWSPGCVVQRFPERAEC